MSAPRAELTQRVVTSLASPPDEALAEVAEFVDFQRYELEREQTPTPPYRSVRLGGPWKGVAVSDEEIAEMRREVWQHFGEDEP